MPQQQEQPAQQAQQPPQNQAPVDVAAGGGGGDGQAEPQPQPSTSGSNGYDASKSRKKRPKESEPWQEKVLKYLEAVDVVAPPPVKKDYIDLALEAVAVQCKENLNKNEILDTVDEIQQLVSRVCRDKRRREEIQRNPPPPPAAAGGFQGAMGLPPMNYNNEPQFYNM